MVAKRINLSSLGPIWDTICDELKKHGIDIDAAGSCCDSSSGEHPGARPARVKVVCVAPDLSSCVSEISQQTRGQVVMVRVDEQTAKDLDAWVETGAVKSRSEAAAVFIREGLKLRATELEQLREAIDGVEQAKARLREKAREVFGERG